MTKRQCFIVVEGQKNANGYIPSAVFEDESGHRPMIGSGEHAAPWYWGQDFETAQRICAEENERLGLSEADVKQIVNSSIAAQLREDGAHSRAQRRLEGRPEEEDR
jgi:hypothetical protein